MKKSLILLCAFLCLLVFPAAALDVSLAMKEWGTWNLKYGRMYQDNLKTSSSRIHFPVEQQGSMLYKFNVRYEGGGEDGHAGVGVHVFVDKPSKGFAWGDGNSYLLWLNYDENPGNSKIPAGLSAQIYKSTSNSRMVLLDSISLREYESYLTGDILGQSIPVTLMINGTTGDGWIADPADPSVHYTFKLPVTSPMRGHYVSLRTNGMAASFGID